MSTILSRERELAPSRQPRKRFAELWLSNKALVCAAMSAAGCEQAWAQPIQKCSKRLDVGRTSDWPRAMSLNNFLQRAFGKSHGQQTAFPTTRSRLCAHRARQHALAARTRSRKHHGERIAGTAFVHAPGVTHPSRPGPRQGASQQQEASLSRISVEVFVSTSCFFARGRSLSACTCGCTCVCPSACLERVP